MACALYALFGVWDILKFPSLIFWLLIIRAGAVFLGIIFIVISFTKFFTQRVDRNLTLLLLWNYSLGGTASRLLVQATTVAYSYMLVLWVSHTLSGLSFWQATIHSWLMVGLYMTLYLSLGLVDDWEGAVNQLFPLAGAIAAGMLTSFLLEKGEKRNFQAKCAAESSLYRLKRARRNQTKSLSAVLPQNLCDLLTAHYFSGSKPFKTIWDENEAAREKHRKAALNRALQLVMPKDSEMKSVMITADTPLEDRKKGITASVTAIGAAAQPFKNVVSSRRHTLWREAKELAHFSPITVHSGVIPVLIVEAPQQLGDDVWPNKEIIELAGRMAVQSKADGCAWLGRRFIAWMLPQSESEGPLDPISSGACVDLGARLIKKLGGGARAAVGAESAMVVLCIGPAFGPVFDAVPINLPESKEKGPWIATSECLQRAQRAQIVVSGLVHEALATFYAAYRARRLLPRADSGPESVFSFSSSEDTPVPPNASNPSAKKRVKYVRRVVRRVVRRRDGSIETTDDQSAPIRIDSSHSALYGNLPRANQPRRTALSRGGSEVESLKDDGKTIVKVKRRDGTVLAWDDATDEPDANSGEAMDQHGPLLGISRSAGTGVYLVLHAPTTGISAISAPKLGMKAVQGAGQQPGFLQRALTWGMNAVAEPETRITDMDFDASEASPAESSAEKKDEDAEENAARELLESSLLPVLLSFRDKDLEVRYKHDYARRNRNSIRISCFVILAQFMVFALQDVALVPIGIFINMFIIRVAQSVVAILLLLSTAPRGFLRHMQLFTFVACIAWIVGVCLLVGSVYPVAHNDYHLRDIYTAIVLRLVMYVTASMRLRYFVAAVLGWAFVTIYAVYSYFIGWTIALIAGDLMWLVSLTALGLLASHMLEKKNRMTFRLQVVRMFLDERVFMRRQLGYIWSAQPPSCAQGFEGAPLGGWILPQTSASRGRLIVDSGSESEVNDSDDAQDSRWNATKVIQGTDMAAIAAQARAKAAARAKEITTAEMNDGGVVAARMVFHEGYSKGMEDAFERVLGMVDHACVQVNSQHPGVLARRWNVVGGMIIIVVEGCGQMPSIVEAIRQAVRESGVKVIVEGKEGPRHGVVVEAGRPRCRALVGCDALFIA